MKLRHFIANFFRQGTDESSTRLVGILGFLIGIAMAAVAVVGAVYFKKEISPMAMSTIGLVLAHSGVALGLRKSPEKCGPEESAL